MKYLYIQYLTVGYFCGEQDVLEKLNSLINPDGTARKRAVSLITLMAQDSGKFEVQTV